ncbi:DUF424 family protein [Candidatus Micrarchaeota archaeon]|nr:DUF424 family protein [Candidatus Micrarchaeota archaeon]
MRIWVKESGGVVAACDEELLAKNHEWLNKSFFRGRLVEPAELAGMLKTATNVNLLGENATNAGVMAGIVTRIGNLHGIPFTLAVSV